MLEHHPFTMSASIHDHPEWHHGRTEYALWLIRVDSAEIAERVEAAKQHLDGFMLEPYLRQPHITICVCGFPSTALFHDDDYSRERFEMQVQAVQDAAIGPFSVEIGGLNSFASAPFLEVYDNYRGLEQLRAALLMGGGEIGRDTFIRQQLRTFHRNRTVLEVDRITFAVYQARETAGSLAFRQDILLRRG
jgi:hypothetical protein